MGVIVVNHWIVGKMVSVLRGARGLVNVSSLATQQAGMTLTGLSSSGSTVVETTRSQDLEELAKKIEVTSALCTQLLIGTVIGDIAIGSWGLATLNTQTGMQWSSFVFALGSLLITVPGCFAAVWFHAFRSVTLDTSLSLQRTPKRSDEIDDLGEDKN
ncbi:hypothetical protein HK102_013138 [Quaeritorhiza haematococci]|nr:hypothetical protein HK102_013138 [Quaeritorhiza haematococci]